MQVYRRIGFQKIRVCFIEQFQIIPSKAGIANKRLPQGAKAVWNKPRLAVKNLRGLAEAKIQAANNVEDQAGDGSVDSIDRSKGLLNN